MRVKKVLNNSVVLGIDENGREAVLLGAGLGFALSAGMTVDPAKVERTFVPESPDTVERLALFAQEIPLAHIELTDRIAVAASERLRITITEHQFIPLADHISFALRRVAEGAPEVDYPLRWEVQQLYPEELRFARTALDMIRDATGTTLPSVEAVPLALHFVNAQLGASDITTAMQMTEVMTEALGIVGAHFDIEIDELSLPVARLVTHLRYLFLRRNREPARPGAELPFDREIRAALPAEHMCAEEIAALLGERWRTVITPEETLYLTLHIGRLTAALRESAEAGDEAP